MDKFVNNIYNFVELNKDYLTNQYLMSPKQNINENIKFNIDNFMIYYNSIQNPTIKKLLDIYKYIYENVTYISIDKTIEIINNNIEELNTLYKDYEPILIIGDTRPQKSNFYFMLYFLYNYNIKTGKKINNMFIKIE